MRYHVISLCLAVAIFSSCRSTQTQTESKKPGAEKPEGSSVTDWTERTELFMEYPPLVAGSTGRFAVHFTRLDNFKPMKEGYVEVQLEDERGIQRFSTPRPSHPGIFGVDVKPSKAGSYTMT